jgi:DNA-binding Lrp family transcriptional regulator
MTLTDKEQKLLDLLQHGLPLEARPFAVIGGNAGFAEAEVTAFIRRMFAEKKVQRLGAIFDARRLGYQSVLCAVSLPDEASLVKTTASVAAFSGVTHCYERGWPSDWKPQKTCAPESGTPNLWFTLAVLREDFDQSLEKIRLALSPTELLVLPAMTRFKIDQVFDPQTRDRDERIPDAAEQTDETTDRLSSSERAVVRLLQENMEPRPDFFQHAADALNMSVDELLHLLRNWQARGILRRVALRMRRAQDGLAVNSMCVWHVPPDRMQAAGRRLAAFPGVSHCYERKMQPVFPYNLFAMVGVAAEAAAQKTFATLSQAIGVKNGCMLCSLREFKRTGMVYFGNEENRS